MKKFSIADLPVDSKLLTETPIRGDIDIEQLIFRQIERTYLSALQDESLFAANVRLLLSTVPSHKQAEILEEKSSEFTSTTQTYQYKYWCGVPLGTPQDPVNGSPTLVEEEVIDWHKLFEIILNALEECGVTWEFDKMTIETGKVESEDLLPIPTPNLTRNVQASVNSANTVSHIKDSTEPEQYKRPCAICGQHVHPGTGKFYQHKLVHKKDCLDIAQTKWKSEQPE